MVERSPQMTLVERLRNPMWESDHWQFGTIDASPLKLNSENAVNEMNEAADHIVFLQRLVKELENTASDLEIDLAVAVANGRE